MLVGCWCVTGVLLMCFRYIGGLSVCYWCVVMLARCRCVIGVLLLCWRDIGVLLVCCWYVGGLSVCNEICSHFNPPLVCAKVAILTPHCVRKEASFDPPLMCAKVAPFAPLWCAQMGLSTQAFRQHTCAQMCCPNLRKQAHFNGPVRKRGAAILLPFIEDLHQNF